MFASVRQVVPSAPKGAISFCLIRYLWEGQYVQQTVADDALLPSGPASSCAPLLLNFTPLMESRTSTYKPERAPPTAGILVVVAPDGLHLL